MKSECSYSPAVVLNLLALCVFSGRVFALTDAVAQPYPPIIQGTPFGYASSLVIDGAGNRYVIGYFSGQADFNPGIGIDAKTSGGTDTFVSRFNADGIYGWTQTIDCGANGVAVGGELALSSDGSTVYAVGYFNGILDIGNSGSAVSASGFFNSFIVALKTSDGTARTGFGTGGIQIVDSGTLDNEANAVCATPSALYVAGDFSGDTRIGGSPASGECFRKPRRLLNCS